MGEVIMSIAGSINSLSDVNISYIGSAEDAIALSSAVQLGVSDELSKFLKVEIEAKNSLSDVIKNYSGIKAQLSSLISQPISKVTSDSLMNAGTSTAAITQLFNADGIRLASNFDDSSAALQNLQDQGVSLSTCVEYPAFQQDFDSKGNLLSQNVSWIGPEGKDFINAFLSSAPSKLYANATVYYTGEPGKSTQITIFNDQKNIRVDPKSVNDSLVQAKDRYDASVDILTKSIAKINAATGKLNDAIDDISKVSASQQKMISDLRITRQDLINQDLNTRRIDRNNFLNKLNQNNQFENEINSIDSINSDSINDRNKSNKVENISPISDWKSTETKSSLSLEQQIFQRRDNSNAEQPQNKMTPFVDIGKII
jgi:hypothetical protein